MRVSARLRSAALMPLPASSASLDRPSALKVFSTRETALSVVRWEWSMEDFQPWDGWNAASYMPGDDSCGNGLARESGVSVKWISTDTVPSRASPLPQVLYGVS